LLKPGTLAPLQHVPWLYYRPIGRGLRSLNKVPEEAKANNRINQKPRKATPGLGKLGTRRNRAIPVVKRRTTVIPLVQKIPLKVLMRPTKPVLFPAIRGSQLL